MRHSNPNERLPMLIKTTARNTSATAHIARESAARHHGMRAVRTYLESAVEIVQAQLDTAGWLALEGGAGECPDFTALERAWFAHPEQSAQLAAERAFWAQGGVGGVYSDLEA